MATNPEIRIGADLSAAKKAVDEFGKQLDDASKPINVEVITAGAESSLKKLTDEFEKLSNTGKMPGAVDGANNLAAALDKARKAQEILAREGIKASREQVAASREAFSKWRDSGVRGTRKLKGQELEDFVGGGWRATALSEADARRTRSQVMTAVGLPGAPGGEGGGQPRSLGAFAAASFARAGRGLYGQIMPHGGVGGQIAESGVAEAAGAGGLLTGLGAGRLLAGGAIGAAAFGAMKLVGGVMGKVGAASDDQMSRSDMGRSIGATVEDFERLRESSQALARGLSVTTSEATSLARAYAAGAGITQNERGRIYGEAGQAGSFGRQLGLDVGTTTGQFAELRRTGQDSPDRLGRSIADAISKRGDFGRLAEVMGSLTSFSSTVATASLTRGNTDNLLETASRLAALKLPGMETAEGVGHMAAMDAGFRGGAGGEAGDLLLLQGLQRQGLPATGYDAKSVRESGLMANLSDVFGANSPAFKAAQAAGNQAEMQRLARMSQASGSTLDMVYGGIKGRFSNIQERGSAMQSITGAGAGDTYALMAAMDNGGSQGVLARLKARGIDTSRMSVGQMAQATGVLGSSDEELAQRKADMLGRTGGDKLTAAQAATLTGAKNPDELRTALTKIASTETIKSEGEQNRAAMASIQQALQSLGDKLLAPLVVIREAVVGVAKFFGVIDQKKVDELMGMSKLDTLKRDRTDLQKSMESGHDARPGSLSWRRAHDLDAQIAAEEAKASVAASAPTPVSAGAASPSSLKRDQQVAALASKASPYDDAFAAAAKQYGVSASDLKLIAARESGMNPNASNRNTNGTEDLGLMQHNSAFLKERGLSREDALNPDKAIPAAAKLWSQLLKEEGGDRRAAFRRYNGSGSAADAYSDDMMVSSALMGGLGDASGPMSGDRPAAGRFGAGAPQTPDAGALRHSVDITIKDPRDNVLASLPEIPLHDGRPNAAGTSAAWSAQ